MMMTTENNTPQWPNCVECGGIAGENYQQHKASCSIARSVLNNPPITQPAPDTGEWREWSEPYYVKGQGWLIADSEGCVVQARDEVTTAQIIADHNTVPRLVETLNEILNEAEFVGEAKQPFSTWVAEKCRTALTTLRRSE